jgi:hypothetical protein
MLPGYDTLGCLFQYGPLQNLHGQLDPDLQAMSIA